jgi:hypothetical protein
MTLKVQKTLSLTAGTDYKITNYSYQQAKKLNVEIKPSSNKKKKIDVFKGDKKIASIGDMNYINNDYPTFLKTKGVSYANERRKLYKQRHKKDLNSKNGYFANNILW